MPTNIRVETVSMDTGRLDVKVIDHDHHNSRVWLGRHCFWAMRCGHRVTTEPTKERANYFPRPTKAQSTKGEHQRLIDMLARAYAAFDGEEESVKDEHANLIKEMNELLHSVKPEGETKFSTSILWGETPDIGQESITYEFASQAELNAFLKGVSEADGWLEYREVPEGFVWNGEEPKDEFESEDDDWSCANCGETAMDGSETCISCGAISEENNDQA